MASLVDESADLVVEFTDLNDILQGGLFTDETAQRITDSAVAMDALEVSSGLLKIQLADGLAPEVERTTDKMTALMLGITDAFGAGSVDAVASFRSTLDTLSPTLKGLIKAVGPKGWGKALDAADGLIGANESKVIDLKEALEGQEQVAERVTIAQRLNSDAQKKAAQVKKDAAQGVRDYTRALREQEKAEKELAKFIQDGIDLQAQRLSEDERASDQADADAAFLHGVRMAEIAEKDAAHQRVMDQIDAERANRIASAFAAVDVAGAAANDMRTIMGEQAKSSKGLAIFEIGVSTAAAVMKAIEQYGLPWGLIPAGLSVAAGVAQVANVNKESFHTGGLLGSNSPPNVDEQFRTLRNEVPVGVLTAQGLNAANRGEGGSQSITIVQKLDHRTFNAQAAQVLEMNSPISRAIRDRRGGPVGQRRR